MNGQEFRVSEVLACPLCKCRMLATPGSAAKCQRCDVVFPALRGTWDLVPYEKVSRDPLWRSWSQTQENGSAAYRSDPTSNLSLGNREDGLAFGAFCAFDGPVLDVGCGPQNWPSYFDCRSQRTHFVGTDPLVLGTSEKYPQVRALGECLPFVAGIFRHVVFATSLDHMIDPGAALSEAVRVLMDGGEIALWVGEKSPGAPEPSESPEWYRRLQRPEGAEDVFHMKRLVRNDIYHLAAGTDLTIVDEQVHHADEYRRNCFLRFRRQV